MKIPAQQVCDILNENIDIEGFCESMRGRVIVTEYVAKNTDVSCSIIEGGFDSSPLGFINLLVDTPIALSFNEDDEVNRGYGFVLKIEAEKEYNEKWDKYDKDYDQYVEDLKISNKENGTDIRPAPRKAR